ncbi:site-specific integrase [Vibrio parahaemolyticus]|nr:site-specific integrase [Vibrio parahaemolyticus]
MKLKVIAHKLLKRMKTELAYTTFKSDRTKMNRIISDLGERDIETIKYSELTEYVNELHLKYAASTVNAHRSLLNKIFLQAHADGLIKNNLVTQIPSFKRDIEEPTPFTREEIQKIISDPLSSPVVILLFQLGIHTGLRISEILALCWEDIDLKKRVLYVRRSVTDSKYRVPKTDKSRRTVELSTLACDLLEKLMLFSGTLRPKNIQVVQSDNHTQKKEKVRFVFINPQTKKPFSGSKQYASSFFTPMLSRLNVKHRGPGHIRHTFASQSLTCGTPISWISMQMGHTGSQLTERRYARWITQNNQTDYADRLATHIGLPHQDTALPQGNLNTMKKSNVDSINPQQLLQTLSLLSSPDLADALFSGTSRR